MLLEKGRYYEHKDTLLDGVNKMNEDALLSCIAGTTTFTMSAVEYFSSIEKMYEAKGLCDFTAAMGSIGHNHNYGVSLSSFPNGELEYTFTKKPEEEKDERLEYLDLLLDGIDALLRIQMNNESGGFRRDFSKRLSAMMGELSEEHRLKDKKEYHVTFDFQATLKK